MLFLCFLLFLILYYFFTLSTSYPGLFGLFCSGFCDNLSTPSSKLDFTNLHFADHLDIPICPTIGFVSCRQVVTECTTSSNPKNLGSPLSSLLCSIITLSEVTRRPQFTCGLCTASAPFAPFSEISSPLKPLPFWYGDNSAKQLNTFVKPILRFTCSIPRSKYSIVQDFRFLFSATP